MKQNGHIVPSSGAKVTKKITDPAKQAEYLTALAKLQTHHKKATEARRIEPEPSTYKPGVGKPKTADWWRELRGLAKDVLITIREVKRALAAHNVQAAFQYGMRLESSMTKTRFLSEGAESYADIGSEISEHGRSRVNNRWT